MSATQPPEAKERRRALVVLVAASLAYGALAIPGYHALQASALLFGAPEAERHMAGMLFGVALASYLPLTLASLAAAWLLYALRKYRAARRLCLLPLVALLAILLAFLLLEVQAPRL